MVENNALKETIKSLESRDEETVATLQKENEELKTKIVELESRESQVEAGVVETLQKENEELKATIDQLESPMAVVVSQNRAVQRAKAQLEGANSSCNHLQQMVSGV